MKTLSLIANGLALAGLAWLAVTAYLWRDALGAVAGQGYAHDIYVAPAVGPVALVAAATFVCLLTGFSLQLLDWRKGAA